MSCINKNKDCKLDVDRGAQFCNCEDEVSASICSSCFKLHATDWLEHMPNAFNDEIFEVRFKNTRRGYYRNIHNIPLKKGDIVAVEAAPGHDIGVVSLTGDLVARQMKRVGFSPMNGEFLKIYRKAKPYDIERWQEAIAIEHETMIRARQIADQMNLDMKIGDVEFQGDRIKAIFYYIADQRVDFRELIKVFAREFRIRVEMRQIGARQEAGRIGGIGSCGRELCCASWISNFISVTTNSARTQELSLNPQKLAGQCSKLKCCLVYELDNYIESQKEFPRIDKPIEAVDGEYYLMKKDILTRTMCFSKEPNTMVGVRILPVERVKEVLRLNRQGKKVDMFEGEYIESSEKDKTDFVNVIGEDSITRFDKDEKRGQEKRQPRRRGRRRRPRNRDNRNRQRGAQDRQQGGEREGQKGGAKQDASSGQGGKSGNRGRSNRQRRRPDNRSDQERVQNRAQNNKQGAEGGSQGDRKEGESRGGEKPRQGNRRQSGRGRGRRSRRSGSSHSQNSRQKGSGGGREGGQSRRQNQNRGKSNNRRNSNKKEQ